jgi:hypothetical protein
VIDARKTLILNSAMRPAKCAKVEALAQVARLTQRVNHTKLGTSSFRGQSNTTFRLIDPRSVKNVTSHQP